MSRRSWILFLILGVVWGMPYLLIRVAVADLDPVVVAFARCAIGALVLLPFAIRRGALRQALAHWRWVAVFAAVEIAGPWLLLGHAERVLPSSTAGMLVAMTPMLAAVLLAGTERLDARRCAGLVIGFVGVVTILGGRIELHHLGAVGLVILVAVGYATGPIIISRRLGGVPPIGVVALSLVISSAAYAPFVPTRMPDHAVPLEAMLSVVMLGIVCTAGAFLAFFALVAEVGAARSTIITYFNPGVALILGAVVLGEPLTALLPIGLLLIIIGSVLSTSRRPLAGARMNAGEFA